MAFCAAQAVPTVRTSLTAGVCTIVWIASARSERRIRIERLAASRPKSSSPLITRLPDEPHATRLFARSLYQRPPPISFC